MIADDLTLKFLEIINKTSPPSIPEIVADIIEIDLQSDAKKNMQIGVDYYSLKKDIADKKRQMIIDGVKKDINNAPNYKIPHGFHRLNVNQKIDYLLGKPLTIDTENENFAKELETLFTEDFHDDLRQIGKGASNKGYESLHVYPDTNGDFQYTTIPSEQTVFIYDAVYGKTLEYVLRYYTFQYVTKSGTEPRYKAEWWDSDKVHYLVQNDKKVFEYEERNGITGPQPHFPMNNTETGPQPGRSWGTPPFIQFKNNAECEYDLVSYKGLSDAYDSLESGNIDEIFATARRLLAVMGYEGTNPGEFKKNLREFGVALLEEKGDMKVLDSAINESAVDTSLKRIKDSIYTFAQAVDNNPDRFSTAPSGVALLFLYAGLDQKADALFAGLRRGLVRLTDFYKFYLKELKPGSADYTRETVKFTPDKSMIVNTSELIENAIKSKGVLSDETVIGMHPAVADVQEEMRRIEAERGEEIEFEEAE